MIRSFTRGELMVAQAAREIRDGKVVFVGTRLPLIAFVVAKRTHAPRCVGIFELGILRDAPASELLYTMGDPPNVAGARWCTRTLNVMGLSSAARSTSASSAPRRSTATGTSTPRTSAAPSQQR